MLSVLALSVLALSVLALSVLAKLAAQTGPTLRSFPAALFWLAAWSLSPSPA
jgi:hypothetical protein